MLTDVTFLYEKKRYNAQMLNVSGSGAFIEARQIPELDTVIEIRSGFPGVNHTSAVKGKVVWRKEVGDSTGPAGVGVDFINS